MMNEDLLRFFGQLEGEFKMAIKDIEKCESEIRLQNKKIEIMLEDYNKNRTAILDKINKVDSKLDSWVNKMKGAWFAIGLIGSVVVVVAGFVIKLLI